MADAGAGASNVEGECKNGIHQYLHPLRGFQQTPASGRCFKINKWAPSQKV